MPRTVAIVPHTHWDREWYEPFQSFRMRLVHLLDRLLPMLESDPGYARFLLDGQTVVVDDYLAIRPDAEATIRRLAAEGRLSLGPWMVLMDEFMVSGETMVRDLQLGLARASQLGGLMEIGYLPDMFGHVAQMPQLLRLAGLDHAVAWRGIPAAVTQTAFWWEAPDGSRIRTEYLYGSYSNGQDLPADGDGLVQLAVDYDAELGPARLDGLLLMNGTDHQMPQPWLGRVVAEANAQQDDYEFVVTSLPEYVLTQPTDGLTTWTGELRSGARANLLMGVASNRVDVHRACAAAERSVERVAEPLAALFLPADTHPHELLGVAWHNLVCNSAHDSSCACSADEVVDQVLVRYHEARQIAEGVARDARHALGASIDAPAGSTVVVNPTARDRGGIVEVDLPGHGPMHFVAPHGEARRAQLVAEHRGEDQIAIVEGEKVRWLVQMFERAQRAGTRAAAIEITDDGRRHRVVVRTAAPGEPEVDLAPFLAQLRAWGQAGDAVHLRVTGAPRRTIVFDAGTIPGFGWSAFRPVEGPTPPEHGGGVAATAHALANEHLQVAVADDGTFAISTLDGITVSGLGRLVDGGDGGDTYNYSPPAADRIVDRPATVRHDVLETGPVRGRLQIDATYRWPTHALGDEYSCSARSEETADVVVRTTLELRSGERFVRVRTEFDNPCRDHRLRAHFPLPEPVDGSDAECAFTVVHRGLTAEGGELEFGLPTFPSRRFVDASNGRVGLALVHDGLLEYEVVDEGKELALTLLRATGYLSRGEPSLRPNPAGPYLPVAGAQMLGRNLVEYAVYPHHGDWRTADLYGIADEVLVPLIRTRGAGRTPAPRPAAGRALRVDGAEVSAVHRDRAGLVVRVFRTAPVAGPVTIELEERPARGTVVDLRDRPRGEFDGTVTLRPWEITTLRIAER